MKFNGTPNQNRWASEILEGANLTPQQTDNLLRWAGPTLHRKNIMDVTIVIENRHWLAAYADALGRFLTLTPAEKRRLAEDAVSLMGTIINQEINS